MDPHGTESRSRSLAAKEQQRRTSLQLWTSDQLRVLRRNGTKSAAHQDASKTGMARNTTCKAAITPWNVQPRLYSEDSWKHLKLNHGRNTSPGKKHEQKLVRCILTHNCHSIIHNLRLRLSWEGGLICHWTPANRPRDQSVFFCSTPFGRIPTDDRCYAEVEGLGDVMKQVCVYIYITIYTRVEACVAHVYVYILDVYVYIYKYWSCMQYRYIYIDCRSSQLL